MARRQLLSLLGRWRRQLLLLSLLGCRCAGAHCYTQSMYGPGCARRMCATVGEPFETGDLRFAVNFPRHVLMFNPPAALEPSLLCEMSPGQGARGSDHCEFCDTRSAVSSQMCGLAVEGLKFAHRTGGGLLPTRSRPS